MSMTGGRLPPDRPDDDDRVVVAAEIALGLARAADVDRVLRADPRLAREIERWEADFAKLADDLAPVRPSTRSWAAIQQAMLAGSPSRRHARSWLDNLLFWRWLAGVGFASAVALAAVLLALPREPATAPLSTHPLFVAAILPKEGPPLYTATYDPSRRTFIVLPAALRPEPRPATRLWLVASDDDDPVALATLNDDRPTVVTVPVAIGALVTRNASLVVTGESTATEPGPVLAHGRLESF